MVNDIETVDKIITCPKCFRKSKTKYFITKQDRCLGCFKREYPMLNDITCINDILEKGSGVEDIQFINGEIHVQLKNTLIDEKDEVDEK